MPMPTPNKGETKAQFVKRFMANPDMIEEHAEETERYAVAIKQWKARMKQNESRARRFSTFAAQSSPVNLIHTDTLQGKEYTVIPYILINEGVHNNFLFPAAELESSVPLWNGRPVVAPHPMDAEGNPISANDPDVLEELQVGWLWNADYEPNKLKAEVWLDPDLLAKHPEGRDIQTKIDKGELIEGSIGAYTFDLMENGEWEGEEYIGKSYDPRADHFAILPNSVGACSVEDGGGGPRIHSEKEPSEKGMLKWIKTLLQGGLKKHDTSTNETERQIRDLIKENVPDEKYVWVVDIFPQEGYCIYEIDAEGKTGLYKQGYGVTDGEAALTGTPVEVRRDVSYVEVTNQGEAQMTVDEVIKHEQTRFTEDDRTFLEGFDAKQLEKLIPADAPAETPASVQKVEAQAPAEGFNMDTFMEGVKTTVIETMKAEKQAEQEVEADKIRASLRDNEDCKLPESALKELGLATLRELQKQFEPEDYSGRGGVRSFEDSGVEGPAPCILRKDEPSAQDDK